MSIIFVSSLNYNIGGAVQHRHQNYFKYLNEGNSLLVNLNNEKFQDENLQIISFPKCTKIIPWKIKILFLLFPMLIISFFKVKSNKILFCYDRNFIVLGMCFLFSKIFKIKLIHEITEYPDVVLDKDLSGLLTLKFFEKFFIKKIDGLVVISRALYEYVSLRSNIKKVIVPSFVDLNNKVDMNYEIENRAINFSYAGSLNQQKDGVLDLVHAFNICKKNNIGIPMKLNIYGGGIDDQSKKIKGLIDSYDLNNQIILHGYKSKKEIERALEEATVLLHCRPLSKQAKGGFSTKLTEYLSTGKPVITTITSDIGRYCTNGENVFLVPPNDVRAFASQMSSIVNELEFAKNVGVKGYSLAVKNFSAETNIVKLKNWMKENFL